MNNMFFIFYYFVQFQFVFALLRFSHSLFNSYIDGILYIFFLYLLVTIVQFLSIHYVIAFAMKVPRP